MKDKEKKHLLRWFLGLMEDRLPIYLFCILISSMGTAFSKIANAWIVESVVSAAQSRNPDGFTNQDPDTISGICVWLVLMENGHYALQHRRKNRHCQIGEKSVCKGNAPAVFLL